MTTRMTRANKIRSFWDRPEGTAGMIVGTLLALGVGVGLYKLLPFIIVLLQNAITATALFAVLAAIIFVASDKKVHNLVGYGYKMAMRALTGMLIDINPISIMKTYISELKAQMETMAEMIRELMGQKQVLDREIREGKRKAEHSLQLAKRARDAGMSGRLRVEANKAGRRERANLRYQELSSKLEFLIRMLRKMHEVAGLKIEDMEDEVEIKSKERKMVRSATKAIRAARAIMNGDATQLEMFDMAMERTVEEIGMGMGEFEDFLETSRGFMDTLDLENGIYEEEALARLEAWEQKTESLLLGGGQSPAEIDKISHDEREVLDTTSPPTRPAEKTIGTRASRLRSKS